MTFPWRRLIVWICLLNIGCGPLTVPMLRRLEPDEQKHVESAWYNMLTPVKRVDRETLLDCLMYLQMYQRGVDRFEGKSVKNTPQGRVEMIIHFDRAKPKKDQFRFRVIGNWGFPIREESWTGQEVWARLESLSRDETASELEMATKQIEAERRMERLIAATQPAAK
jgi:hypothetical protein